MKVIWLDDALNSYHQIIDYLAIKFDSKTARKLDDKVSRVEVALCNFPDFGSIDPLFGNKDYRCVIILQNKLVYRVVEDTIYILAFWDCRRDSVAQAKKVK